MSSSVPTPAPNNPPPSSPSTASASSNTKLRQRSHRKVNYISLGLATLNQGLAPALSFWKRQGMLLKLAVYSWLLCTWWIFALLALFWLPPAFNLLTIAYICVYDAPTYVEHLEQAIQDNYGLSFPTTFKMAKIVADLFNNTIGLGIQLVIYFTGYIYKKIAGLVHRTLRFWIGVLLVVAEKVVGVVAWLSGATSKGSLSAVSSRSVSRNPSPTPRKLVY